MWTSWPFRLRNCAPTDPAGALGYCTCWRSALIGAVFGLSFPLVAWLFDLSYRGLAVSPTGLWAAHQANPLHWIIDSAPFVLGAAGYVVGFNLRRIEAYNVNLEREVASRTADLRASVAYFRLLVEHGSDMITVLEADGKVQYWSPSVERVLGYSADELVGEQVFAYIHADDAPSMKQTFLDQLAKGRSGLHREFRFRHHDGSWRMLEALGTCLPGPVPRMVVNSHDITDHKRDELALEHLALFDGLTGLPNRSLFQDRLESALRSAERTTLPVAILLLDLDRFKDVNDTLGHQAGDVLLAEVGRRMATALRASDTLARLGGDEFAIVLPATDAAGGLKFAEKLQLIFDQAFVVDGRPLTVGASIGIASWPDHGACGQDLIRCADVAMYVAKRDGRRVAAYSSGQDQYSTERLALTADLRAAIDAGELELYFQPKAVLGTGAPAGVEALTRWQRGTHGFVEPETFIAVAEETGLIHSLTRWVLDTALAQSRTWRDNGMDVLVAVNVSMRNLQDPGLHDQITTLLLKHGVPADRLQLELTETSLMLDPPHTLEVLNQLHAIGIRISIDDFGTGYSSLAYLKRLPIDELKIDKGFVLHMCDDENDAIIVRSTIGLGHALGMTIVAEGIEDQATWEHLAALGCDVGQGYFLSRPLPAPAATDVLRGQHHARTGALH